MNLDAFIDGLTRTARNLPSLLLDWSSLEADLRGHYADAVIELIVSYDGARRHARPGAESLKLHHAWVVFRYAIVQHAAAIAALMDIKPLELLAPSSVSGAAVSADAFSPDELELPSAA